MRASRSLASLLFVLCAIAASAGYFRPLATEPSSPNSTPIRSIAPRSLTIHGVRPGMSRQQITKLLGPGRNEERGATSYLPASAKSPESVLERIAVSYKNDLANGVRGDRVELSGKPYLTRGLSQELLRSQLGPPTFVDRKGPETWFYDDLQFVVNWAATGVESNQVEVTTDGFALGYKTHPD